MFDFEEDGDGVSKEVPRIGDANSWECTDHFVTVKPVSQRWAQIVGIAVQLEIHHRRDGLALLLLLPLSSFLVLVVLLFRLRIAVLTLLTNGPLLVGFLVEMTFIVAHRHHHQEEILIGDESGEEKKSWLLENL